MSNDRLVPAQILDTACQRPEARPQSHMVDNSPPRSGLGRLPRELLIMIAKSLRPGDIRRLRNSCWHLNKILEAYHYRQDIESRSYSAAYFACFFNEPSILKRTLDAGGDPNAVFCRAEGRTDSHTGADSDLFTDPDAQAQPREFIVFPDVRMGSYWLWHSGPPCNMLALATQKDHITIMDMLISRGARAHQNVPNVSQDLVRRVCDPMKIWPRRMVLAYARSPAAVSRLIEFYTPEELDDNQEMGHSILSMILSTFISKSAQGPLLSRERIASIVRRLLSTGYRPYARPEIGPALVPRPAPGRSTPVITAIAARSLETIELLLRFMDPIRLDRDMDDGTEAGVVLQMALWQRPLGGVHQPRDREFASSLLGLIIDHTRPSREEIWGLMPMAFSPSANRLTIETLLQRGGIKPPSMAQLCALALAIESIALSRLNDHQADGLLDLLDRLGVDASQSLDDDNTIITPLILASHPSITPHVFQRVLRMKADPTLTFRVLSLGSGTCVVGTLASTQFGFNGYFAHDQLAPNDCEMQGVEVYLNTLNGLDDSLSLRSVSVLGAVPPEEFERLLESQQLKLQALYDDSQPPYPAFHGSSGKHVLSWAIEELDGIDIAFAVRLYHPFYDRTKVNLDKSRPPVLHFFYGRHTLDEYLEFGDLRCISRLVLLFIREPLSDQYRDGETILHKLCRLNPVLGTEDRWDELTSDIGVRFTFSNSVVRTMAHLRGSAFVYNNICYSDLCNVREIYELRRRSSIVDMINTVILIGGVDPNAIRPKDNQRPADCCQDRAIQEIIRRYAAVRTS